VLAPILGAMNSEAAQKLTVRLASRLKVSEAQTNAAAQLASVAPPAGATPAPAASAQQTPQAQAAPAAPTPATPSPTK